MSMNSNFLENIEFLDEGIDLNNFSKEAEIAKYDGFTAAPWELIIRLFINPPKTSGGVYVPQSVHDEQQYQACVGLVVKQGCAVYLDARYEQTGRWCEVGDWIVFPRHAGIKIHYQNLPTFIIKEDGVSGVLLNPLAVRR